MPRSMGSVTLTIGMVGVPLKIAKASVDEAPDLKSLCECGGRLGPIADDDGNKVECQDCGDHLSWYNSAPQKGYELGDDMIPLSKDEVKEARQDAPVETGNVEKVVPVKDVLLEYAVTGNYYLMPEEDFASQYGALVRALNEEALCLLTYIQLRTKTQRFAVTSEGGVLLALRLADKKPLTDLDYGVDEQMEAQAKQMVTSMASDDPTLEDVEAAPLKELIASKVEADLIDTDEEMPEIDV